MQFANGRHTSLERARLRLYAQGVSQGAAQLEESGAIKRGEICVKS